MCALWVSPAHFTSQVCPGDEFCSDHIQSLKYFKESERNTILNMTFNRGTINGKKCKITKAKVKLSGIKASQ